MTGWPAQRSSTLVRYILSELAMTLLTSPCHLPLFCAVRWAMWAVVQAARSEIHFGYMEYAVQRLEQYYKWKKTLTERFGS